MEDLFKRGRGADKEAARSFNFLLNYDVCLPVKVF